MDLREPAELQNDGMIEGRGPRTAGMLEFYADPHNPYYRNELDRTPSHCALLRLRRSLGTWRGGAHGTRVRVGVTPAGLGGCPHS